MTIVESSEVQASREATRPSVSFVVPAYNESARLPASLGRIIEFLASQGLPSAEVVVVDDGSTDRTPWIVRQRAGADLPDGLTLRLVQHARNQGKGAAIRTGCLDARGACVFFIDADLASPPEEAPKLLAALRAGADVAIGSRIQPDGTDMRASQPRRRRFVGALFTRMRKLLRVLPDIEDTQCPLKGFRHDVAQAVFRQQRLSGWIFDAEVLFIARALGYGIVSVPVTWRHVEGSRLRVGPKQAFEVARDLARLRFLHRGVKAVVGERAR